MTSKTMPTLQKTPQLDQSQIGRHPGNDDGEDTAKVQSILIDTALEVAALIDAVCCRCGDWVDWQRYRPHGGTRKDNQAAVGLIIRLALSENAGGLCNGGYIEMCVLPEGRLVEADGGYYDEYRQPRQVIAGSLRWQQANHQTLGQALLLIYGGIMREYMVHGHSAEVHPAVWTDKPAHLAYVTSGGNNRATGGTA